MARFRNNLVTIKLLAMALAYCYPPLTHPRTMPTLPTTEPVLRDRMADLESALNVYAASLQQKSLRAAERKRILAHVRWLRIELSLARARLSHCNLLG